MSWRERNIAPYPQHVTGVIGSIYKPKFQRELVTKFFKKSEKGGGGRQPPRLASKSVHDLSGRQVRYFSGKFNSETRAHLPIICVKERSRSLNKESCKNSFVTSEEQTTKFEFPDKDTSIPIPRGDG